MPDHVGTAGAKLLQQRRWKRAIGLALLAVVTSGLGIFYCFFLTSFSRWNPFVYVHTASPGNACIANLRQIDGAKMTWALENKKPAGARPTDAELFGPSNYIRAKPDCPGGGTYALGAVGKKPRCSIPGHTI